MRHGYRLLVAAFLVVLGAATTTFPASTATATGTTTGTGTGDVKPVRLAVTTASELLVLSGSQIIARAPTGGIAAVAVHPTRPLMYVAPESGPKNGRLLTYAFTTTPTTTGTTTRTRTTTGTTIRTTTGLTLKSEVRLVGMASVHIAIAGSNEFLVVSHYVNGRASLVHLRADGLPSTKTASTLTIGSGAGSRIHGSAVAPNNRGVWMTDTGRDELISVTLDAKLKPITRSVTMVTKGSGPRSLVLTSDTRHLLVSNEYANSASCFPRVDAGIALGLPTTSPLGSPVEGRPADIVAGPDSVFMANRGPNEIVSFAVESTPDGTCSLEVSGREPSGGKSPRALVTTPSGWCAGNEGSGEIVCGSVSATGASTAGRASAATASRVVTNVTNRVVVNIGRPWGLATLPTQSSE